MNRNDLGREGLVSDDGGEREVKKTTDSTMKACPYRATLPPLPDNMKGLPVDERGYPVPKFVKWIDGIPDFRIMDADHFRECAKYGYCWVCGKPLAKGGEFAFVVGPMCGISRTSSEPPSHLACARYSAVACPFLSIPSAKRREHGLTGKHSAGIAITRNSGVTLVWITRTFKMFWANGPLFTMGDPTSVEWYARGRQATRAECRESIKTGLPAFEEMAAKDPQPGAMAAFANAYNDLQGRLPQ